MKKGCLFILLYFLIIAVFGWIISLEDLGMKIILGIYTVLIFLACSAMIGIYMRNNGVKQFIELIKNGDYKNAARLLEEDKKRIIFNDDHENEIIYLYFINNEYDNYIKTKKDYTPMDFEKKPEIYFKITNIFKITEIMYMYLHDEIDNAKAEYKKFIGKDNEIEKELYRIDYKTWVLFQILKIMYAYYNGNYNEAKKIYENIEYIALYSYNTTIKTLTSYYICRIYGVEGNTDAINAILDDADIQNNPYGIYFDKWRVKQ